MTEDIDPIDDLPDFVRILHHKYTLKERSITDVVTDSRWGHIDFIKNEIQFTNRDSADTADTIIHEILHGLFRVFCIDLDEKPDSTDVEEKVVTLLATGLVTVMRDNPTLFPTLQVIVEDGK